VTGQGRDAELDLAVIGGGIAGTSVAWALRQARPDWSIALFERLSRIGGRLHSVRIDGLDHPIELGGMRYITSHRRVAALIDQFSIPTHAFDPTGGPERSVLRGVVANGADDPDAGRAYALDPAFRERSAHQLMEEAFERIVPGFARLNHDGYAARRATDHYLDRRLTDWPIGEALETVLGREGRRFVTDIFGYDPGMRPFNAPDLIEFLSAGGDPSDEARTPDDGMDRIPRALAGEFEARGGSIHLNRELETMSLVDGAVALRFGDGDGARTKRVILATPLPALRHVASRSPGLQQPPFERVFDSVEGFPAMKLYLWFDQPWWRPAVPGPRTTTDLPLRKVHYFDGPEGSRSALLAMFADGLDVRPWADLFEGAPAGAPAPPAMLAAVLAGLHHIHPEVSDIPQPIGSALMYWGADPHEVAWHFWRAGVVSDEILRLAPQPDETLPIYIANEAFSRHQSWVEGALEAADAVVEKLTSGIGQN
jgi:monoamine oxidase